MIVRVPSALALCLAASMAAAQAPSQPDTLSSAPPAPPAVPDTDVFVADLDLRAGSAGLPRNVTARPGYDNQPAFIADGGALLYVARDDSGSTDIWRVDLRTGTRTQVTTTSEAEYSPTPLADGTGFSAVRVESPHADGEEFTESQRLFRYAFDGRALGPVLADVRRVGYHAWIDATHIALFIVGNDDAHIAHSLVLADLATGRITPLAKDIGRSLGRSPDGRVTFVDQRNADAWTVATIAVGDTTVKLLAPVPQGSADEKPADRSQDFCWLPDGTLLMANEKRLLRWNHEGSGHWQSIAEFQDLPGRIRRLAVRRDGKQVAFVVDMP